MGDKELASVAAWLLTARRSEAVRLTEVHLYLKNRVSDIYVPQSATQEYRQLVDQARFNILPLLVKSLAQNLFVDGYRAAGASENAKPWEAWQANRMDARQAGLYRSALQYGWSYCTVLPGKIGEKDMPVMTPWSPRRMTALYEDPLNDEWPQYAVSVGIPRPLLDGSSPMQMVTDLRILDDNHLYTVPVPAEIITPAATGSYSESLPFDGLAIDPSKVKVEAHDLGVCPVVRFLDSYGDLDDGPEGVVYPMLPAQRQLNQTTFGLLMAQHHAAFRQRWATGMAIAEDEDGNPVEPWNAAVNRVWQNESPDGRFGDFAETNLDGYLNSRDKALLYVASVQQIPPHHLVVGNAVSNISAEALAALDAGHKQDIAEHKTAFGESAEQMMRLAGLIMGDTTTWEDTAAQVRWRDTTPRSLAQVADALGKLAQLLEVPPRALWERIPDTTDTDIERWEELAEERDGVGNIAQLLTAVPAAEDGEETDVPQVPADEVEVPGAQRTGQSADAAIPAADPAARSADRAAS